MTVIAWDGQTLAADSCAAMGSTVYLIDKLRVGADGSIAAMLGDRTASLALWDWWEAGHPCESEPDFGGEEAGGFVLVRPSGEVFTVWSTMPYVADPHEEPHGAWGSGREAALAALRCGRSAANAVEITCEICVECRLPVRSRSLPVR